MSKALRVKELAEVSGVSVRTLHYYDEIGLLRPSGRSSSDYRLYSEKEVLRLQQILIRRELGFSLAEIAKALDDLDFNQREALLAQRAELAAQGDRTGRMIDSIDAALAELVNEGRQQEDVTMKEIFDGFDPAEYDEEVKERWGGTDALRISADRVKNYTDEDWQAIKDQSAAIYSDLKALLAAGESAESEAVMDVAERHRLSIDRRFYPCSHGMHTGLADMYEADQRFRDSIDKFGEGLTPFLSAAIRANAKRHS